MKEIVASQSGLTSFNPVEGCSSPVREPHGKRRMTESDSAGAIDEI
jgi:hypothetical protein